MGVLSTILWFALLVTTQDVRAFHYSHCGNHCGSYSITSINTISLIKPSSAPPSSLSKTTQVIKTSSIATSSISITTCRHHHHHHCNVALHSATETEDIRGGEVGTEERFMEGKEVRGRLLFLFLFFY